jgi:hypothetical protein
MDFGPQQFGKWLVGLGALLIVVSRQIVNYKSRWPLDGRGRILYKG